MSWNHEGKIICGPQSDCQVTRTYYNVYTPEWYIFWTVVVRLPSQHLPSGCLCKASCISWSRLSQMVSSDQEQYPCSPGSVQIVSNLLESQGQNYLWPMKWLPSNKNVSQCIQQNGVYFGQLGWDYLDNIYLLAFFARHPASSLALCFSPCALQVWNQLMDMKCIILWDLWRSGCGPCTSPWSFCLGTV